MAVEMLREFGVQGWMALRTTMPMLLRSVAETCESPRVRQREQVRPPPPPGQRGLLRHTRIRLPRPILASANARNRHPCLRCFD
eukprot:6213196-Pleurochrysis_carterae.AAC.5